jgi:exopolyphosphatase/guanosine-5'-triphosphate,3'-diphosphate pyrophosphatase
MRVATIDIGTNSVLLLVAETRLGDLVPLVERATITRLGQGVDASRSLSPAAVTRTERCLQAYSHILQEQRVERRACMCTSAMRDARDGERFLESVEGIIGVRPEVLSGTREAELSFAGALVGMRPPEAERVAVFDVGGGSTEIIVGTPGAPEPIERAVSLDVGAVRLTERHIASDPPSAAAIAAVRADIREALRQAPPLAGLPLVGVAGTVTSLAALAAGVAPYDPTRVHGSILDKEELQHLIERLATMTLAERRRLAALDPRRADVIVAGALLVDEICTLAEARSLAVSDRGVRWGRALELAGP